MSARRAASVASMIGSSEHLPQSAEERNYALSPFYRLPDELILKIFGAMQDHLIQDYMPHGSMIPWWGPRLSVSRRVRLITHRSPELWTFVQIGSKDPRNVVISDLQKDWLTSCLPYAGGFLLRVYVYSFPRPLPSNTMRALRNRTSSLHTNVKFCQRVVCAYPWTALDQITITAAFSDLRPTINSTFLFGCDSLQFLHLRTRPDHMPWMFDRIHNDLVDLIKPPHFPRLRDLRIEGIRLENNDLARLSQWLSSMPLLQRVTIGLNGLDCDEGAPVELEYLHTLTLRGSTNDLCAILPIFSDPLRILSLEIVPADDWMARFTRASYDEEHSNIVDRATSFMTSRSNPSIILSTYTVRVSKSYPQEEWSPKSYCIELRSDVHSSSSISNRRLVIQEYTTNPDHMLAFLHHPQINTVQIASEGILADVVSAMPCTQSYITSLSLNRKALEKRDEVSLLTLKHHLGLRLQNGCPLDCLILDAECKDPGFQSIASAWAAEGLLDRVIRTKIRGHNDEDIEVPGWSDDCL